MPSPIYATNSDVAEYLHDSSPIDEISAISLLRAASMLVRRATRRDVYEVSLRTGLPNDANLADAMKEAVCAQALAWNTLRIDPVVGNAGQQAAITSKSLGGVSFSYGSVPVAAQNSLDTLGSGQVLSTIAANHLIDAGLMSSRVQVNGGAAPAHIVTSPLADSGTFPEQIA